MDTYRWIFHKICEAPMREIGQVILGVGPTSSRAATKACWIK